jgi:co-chaperonin GroES (HSP10)
MATKFTPLHDRILVRRVEEVGTTKEGDRILFGKYSGTEIKIDGEDLLIMKEEEVLGIVTGAARKETVGAKR